MTANEMKTTLGTLDGDLARRERWSTELRSVIQLEADGTILTLTVNGLGMDVHKGETLEWDFIPNIDGEKLCADLRDEKSELRKMLEKAHAIHADSCEWSESRGEYRYDLDEYGELAELYSEIGDKLATSYELDFYGTTADWIGDENEPDWSEIGGPITAETTDEELEKIAARIESLADEYGQVITDDPIDWLTHLRDDAE